MVTIQKEVSMTDFLFKDYCNCFFAATPSLGVDDASVSGRRLLISRTFRDEGGREYVRHEVVKNQGVIDAYVRIMSGSKDKDIR